MRDLELCDSDRGLLVNDTLSFNVDVRVTRHVDWSMYASRAERDCFVSLLRLCCAETMSP